MSSGNEQKASETQGPDIYTYHDYRKFLVDWCTHLKEHQRGFSVRRLAKESGLSESYLSMVLSGDRSLSADNLKRLGRPLGLDVLQQSYLSWLRVIVESKNENDRLEALKKIQRFRQYRESNSNEIETYEYLTHWHYVAIREMTALSDFQMDPKWIRKRLKAKISSKDVRAALDFLVQYGFIEVEGDGSAKHVVKRVHAKTGVLRPALTKFHRELLKQACDSIETTPTEKRNISAHTAAIPIEHVARFKEILEEARAKIIQLSEQASSEPKEVYHFAFLAFPLTKSVKGDS